MAAGYGLNRVTINAWKSPLAEFVVVVAVAVAGITFIAR
jgi:hypothetical protein